MSAAAGSGKTAALVERTIERLCDDEDSRGIENILAVTFTNAAAARMKEKIRAAIAKRIALNPTDKKLRRLILSLPYADIRTIDSFCIKLVRENFHALGVTPDFGLLDEGELAILRDRAINSAIDALYEKSDESFLRLCELISDDKNDDALVEAILKLHSISLAYPFPERRTRSLAAAFDPRVPPEKSVWGKIISDYCEKLTKSCLSDVRRALELLASEPELEEKYAPAFKSDEAAFEKILGAFSRGWDSAVEACSVPVAFVRLQPAPRGAGGAVGNLCRLLRNGYKKTVGKLPELMCATSAEHEADMKKLSPVIKELTDAVLKFDEEFIRLKREENGADFSDALRLALKLLVEPDGDGDGFVKTPTAQAVSANYDEILIDEYQDVNRAQDMIFSALSRSESNMFMVGDVKQSVYGFRRATPEIFYNRREALPEYKDGNYPARITLGKNFRSREGITETVNFVFEAIMSREAGGLDYDGNERLEAAASFPKADGADALLRLIETEKENFLSAQAKYVADYIENAVNGGLTLTSGGKTRKAKYKDFAVLLRSVKNDSAPFVKEFEARGTPIRRDEAENFVSTPEIMFLISLLKIINNPVDDIPLSAVALSPAFGFTPEDLARLRVAREKGSVYQCVVSAAEGGDAKSADFLEKIRALRRIAATVGTGELVRRLIEETGWGAIVYAMKNGNERRANLNRFIDLANKYETGARGSVSGFIRYLEGAAEIGGGSAKDGGESTADAVRITTIHKSKGLEFPVCFIAACEKKYEEKSLQNDLIIAPKSGIGIKIYGGGAKYDSLPRAAAKIETKTAERSEELRVLYVAMTRAEEKLIMLASSRNWSAELSRIASVVREEKRIEPFKVLNFRSFAECLLAALIRHPDAYELRKAAGVSEGIVLPCKTALDAKIIAGETSERTEETRENAPPDEKLEAEIRKRLSYVYPYSSLDASAAKRIASDFGSPEINVEYFASRRPAFAGEGSMTPERIGTATHRFMRLADYERAKDDAAAELQRLTREGNFTDEESRSLNVKDISKFFRSDLAERIRKSERVYKEYPFKTAVPLAELEPSVPENEARGETVLVEGVVDCAFEENGELVIVDFKTDRSENAAELADRYKGQLEIYGRCLGEVLGKPVKREIIYSFKLGEICVG